MAKVFTKIVKHCSECPNYRKAPWGGHCNLLKINLDSSHFDASRQIPGGCTLEESQEEEEEADEWEYPNIEMSDPYGCDDYL